MPIKQIQLRGISRTPSDRATADGGCAESLNVHLDQQETAPTLPPKDISSQIYYPQNLEPALRYPIVYIHKIAGTTNYIGYNGSYPKAYGSMLGGGSGVDTMGNVYIHAALKHVISIGNMLIIFTAKTPHYFLYKEQAYTYLGTSVPKPKIEVASYPGNALNSNVYAAIDDDFLSGTDLSTDWDAAAMDNNAHHSGLLSAMSAIWDAISVRLAESRTRGCFMAPFFIRYALKLYDGSYIHSSCPILCGGGEEDNWMRLYVSPIPDNKYQMLAVLGNQFWVHLHGTFDSANWGELVDSIDFFASTPIYTPTFNSAYSKMITGREIILEGMEDTSKEKTIHDEVFSKGQFFKILSIPVNDTVEMGKLQSGKTYIRNSDIVGGELLATQDNMPDTYRDGSTYIPIAEAKNFNNRLMLSGANEILTSGDTFLNGQVATGFQQYRPEVEEYTLRFKVIDSATGDAHHVLARYRDGSSVLYPGCFTDHITGQSFFFGDELPYPITYDTNPCVPFAWICYPDSRCKEVEVYYGNSYGKTIPLEPHPSLDCACAFFGFGVPLNNLGSGYSDISTPYDYTENRFVELKNKIFLSGFEMPFLFPAGNIVTFPDSVIGTGAITTPLSEGQVGDFNVYVFTDGGIRVLVTNAEGTFSASIAHPELSRHVAIPGTIFTMEQAVVFISKRGVMLLSGRDVTELSRNMNGKPYILDSSLGDSESGLLINSEWASLLAPTKAAETLMEFMESAKIAYDHNGARLLFFNPTKGYQYEYRLETQTWHKLYTEITAPIILNSYPNCYLSYSDGSVNPVPKILDFSTVLNKNQILSDTQNPIKGIIVTRPFDLGEPDIRKAIRSIRIRGYYNRGDVKYVLLGSFDGHNWQLLPSLRGGSYKMFRLVLLTKLSPMERITWIDVDYESRFANRLR